MREMTMSNTHNETDPPTENTELILSSVDVPEATEAGPDDLVGELLGAYRLQERLGEGGMGEVFRAVHTGLGREVALKRIRSEKFKSEGVVKWFMREVMAAARVDHPYIVRAYDAGSERGCHYLVMELIDGVDLRTIVEKNGPLPIEEALRIAAEMALALAHLDSIGLVHRDVKPTNLIRVRKTGSVKLLDLGLARAVDVSAEDDQKKSGPQGRIVLGTPDYMAPEQILNAHGADIRADLYSLGCTLYYVLTGSVPFPGGTPTQKMLRQHGETPVEITRRRPEIPPEVAGIVGRLMMKNPDDRYQNPVELLSDLTRLASLPLAEEVELRESVSEWLFWREQFSDWIRRDVVMNSQSFHSCRRRSWRRPNLPVVLLLALAFTAFSLALGLFLASRAGEEKTEDGGEGRETRRQNSSRAERILFEQFLGSHPTAIDGHPFGLHGGNDLLRDRAAIHDRGRTRARIAL